MPSMIPAEKGTCKGWASIVIHESASRSIQLEHINVISVKTLSLFCKKDLLVSWLRSHFESRIFFRLSVPKVVVPVITIGNLSIDDDDGNENASKQWDYESKQCSARAFYILVHFFAVLCKTTTWNDQILGFLENVSAWQQVFLSFSFL